MGPLVSARAPCGGISLGPGAGLPSRQFSSGCRALRASSNSLAGKRVPNGPHHAPTWQLLQASPAPQRRQLFLSECATRPAIPSPLPRHTAAHSSSTRAAHRAAGEAVEGAGEPVVAPWVHQRQTHQEHALQPRTGAQVESQGQGGGRRGESCSAAEPRRREVLSEPQHGPETGSRPCFQRTDSTPLPLPLSLPLRGRRGAILALALAAAATGSGYASGLRLGSGSALAAETAVEGEARPQAGGQSPDASVQTRILRGLGIGDPDVYYPRLFLGDWECESILLSVDTPQGVEVADIRAADEARRRIGMPVVYQARFVDFGRNVISERLLTTVSLVEETVGKGVLVDADWSPTRANVLTLTLKGGIKVRNLITKRSFDLSAPGQFDVSEYSKQVLDNQVSVEGPPSVKASGNLTRFRWDPYAAQVDQIEAFQRVAMYPVVGGQASGRGEGGLTAIDVASLGFGEKPTTVYKYLLHLRRVK